MVDPNSSRTLKQVDLFFEGIKLGLRVFYELITGFGKTRLAIMFIKECNKRHPTKIINVVVPTTNLKNDWIDKKKGHIVKNGLKNVHVYVVNTYVKTKHVCGLLICDELHHYCNEESDTFKKVISNTTFNWFVGLSATLEENHKKYLAKHNIVSAGRIAAKEAMDNKWISQYRVLCVPIQLNEEDDIKYQKMHTEFNKHFATFNFDFNLAMKCVTDKQTRMDLANKLGWEVGRIDAAVFNWDRNMRLRKEFLYHVEAKIEAAIEITKKLQIQTILFGQSIKGADKINEALGDKCVEYHSDMTKTQAKENLRKLKDGRTKISYISSAKGLEEGFDLPNLSLGITWSRTSKSLRANQCLGRISRYDYNNPNKIAYMIELYVTGSKGTQDLQWLKKSLKGQHNILWLNSIEQIYQIIEQDKQKLL